MDGRQVAKLVGPQNEAMNENEIWFKAPVAANIPVIGLCNPFSGQRHARSDLSR